ncbi:hypothetical protein K1T71_006702 [Dendrolimus kikuchii]|uniref:Uncharacterized protein n=1 Tax=Dendrolimus kikuchii TaxID=765133 RepID=A0ACC1D1J8_9NEOP|nr:hypothetical protein K1T71_006702 [Dendrolimus kikuchii]
MSSTLNIDDNIELITLKARQDSLFEVLQLIYKKSLQAFDSTEFLQCFQGYAATLDNIRTQFKDTANKYNEVLLMTVPGAVPDYEAMIPFEELFCKIKAIIRRVESKNMSVDCNNVINGRPIALQSLVAVPSTSMQTLQFSAQPDASYIPQTFLTNSDLSFSSVPSSLNNSQVFSCRNEAIPTSMASYSHDVESGDQTAFHIPASTLAVPSKSLQLLTQSDASRLPKSSISKPDLSHKEVPLPLINACCNNNMSTSMSSYSHDVENYIQTASYSDTSTVAVLSKLLSSSALSASDGDRPSQLLVTNTIPSSRNVTKPHNKSYVDSIRVCTNSDISSSITVNSDDDDGIKVSRINQHTYSRASLSPSIAHVAIDECLLKSVSSGRLIKRHCGFKSNDYKLPQNTLLIKGKYNMSFEDIADIRLSRFDNSNPLAYMMFNLPALFKYSLLPRFLSPNMVYNNFNILHPAVRTVLGYDISSPATFKIPHGSFINYNIFAQVCLTLLLRTLWNLKKNTASLSNIEYYHFHEDYRRKQSRLIRHGKGENAVTYSCFFRLSLQMFLLYYSFWRHSTKTSRSKLEIIQVSDILITITSLLCSITQSDLRLTISNSFSQFSQITTSIPQLG